MNKKKVNMSMTDSIYKIFLPTDYQKKKKKILPKQKTKEKVKNSRSPTSEQLIVW